MSRNQGEYRQSRAFRRGGGAPSFNSSMARRENDMAETNPSNGVTVSCGNIRLGGYLLLEGRPCRVIRISTSATGHYHYLGVDVSTDELHKQSSYITMPTVGEILQTMLSPVLKEYSVLGLQNGRITAETDTGEVIDGISIPKHSRLYTRLSQALSDSSNGIIHILVIEDDGKEIAVEMDAFRNSAQKRTNLLMPVDDGHETTAKGVSNQDPDINRLFQDRRTALFSAVKERKGEVVDALIRQGINVNHLDAFKKTALDVAVSDTNASLIVFQLLEGGASPTVGVNDNILKLLSAAARGSLDEVRRLLPNDVGVNGRDRLGYTALHEAFCFGHEPIVTLLLEHHAKVNAKIGHERNTLLHAVVERGKYRSYLGQDSGRRDVPKLGQKHVAIVKKVLKEGAKSQVRRPDGLTAPELISNELAKPDLDQDTRTTLQDILKSLRNTPVVGEDTEEVANTSPSTFDDEKRQVCNQFSARIRYHAFSSDDETPYGERADAVGNFLYPRIEGNPDLGKVLELETWAKSHNDPESIGRWVHFPANNRLWIKDMITAFGCNPGIQLDEDSVKLNEFIDDSFHENRSSTASTPHARTRRPELTLLVGSEQEVFSLVLPYFDWDTLQRDVESDPLRQHFNRLEKHYHKSDLQAPLTLDQSYRSSLPNSTNRDSDQVVVRRAERSEKVKMLVTVNQMWLWKIDRDTIVTAFPGPRYQGQQVDLFDHLSKGTTTSEDMGALIVKLLHDIVGFVDTPNNSGLDKDLLGIFGEEITYLEGKYTDSYTAFQGLQPPQRPEEHALGIRPESNEPRGGDNGSNENDACDITKELRYHYEIKDVGEELKMILQVFIDQDIVIEQIFETMRRTDDFSDTFKEPEFDKIFALLQNISDRISDVEKLIDAAFVVERSIFRLLELKQKQGHLDVARDTRWLATQADRRAEDGEKQNKLLFVFTIVTVIYTPISFASALLAIPSRDFPQDDSGSGVGWRWWQILVAALTTEVITFLFIARYADAASWRGEKGNLYDTIFTYVTEKLKAIKYWRNFLRSHNSTAGLRNQFVRQQNPTAPQEVATV